MNRRGFLKLASGLVVAAGAGELLVPERRVWALDKTMVGPKQNQWAMALVGDPFTGARLMTAYDGGEFQVTPGFYSAEEEELFAMYWAFGQVLKPGRSSAKITNLTIG